MKRRLTFRYGLDRAARIGLILWSCGWLVILVYMLCFGEINAAARGGEITYYRDENPLWYWGTALVNLAMIIFGLAMTFEIEKVNDGAKPNDD